MLTMWLGSSVVEYLQGKRDTRLGPDRAMFFFVACGIHVIKDMLHISITELIKQRW